MTATGRLCAILDADVAGYSRLMGADEEATHERLKAHQAELANPKMEEPDRKEHWRRLFGLSFPVERMPCVAAVEVQRGMTDRDPPPCHRCGLNVSCGSGAVNLELSIYRPVPLRQQTL